MTSISSRMMVDYMSKVGVASSPFWVVQLHIMSPKVGQCHLPPASEVDVASSLLQGHVHAMSKSWRHSSWNFKVLASPCIFKVLMRALCNVKVLASPYIFKVLIGTPCIFNILLASLKSWCLATVLYALDVWAMLPLKIALWQRWTLAQLRRK